MKKTLTLLLLVCLCAALLCLTGCAQQDPYRDRYQEAAALMDAGDYAAAEEAFLALGDYEDSASRAAEARLALDYAAARELMAAGSFEEALAAFEALSDYADSGEQAALCRQELDYAVAASAAEEGNYAAAIAGFEALGGFRDSAARAEEATYALALQMVEQGRFEQAAQIFRRMSGYGDSDALLAQMEELIEARSAVGEAEEGELVYFGRYEQDGSAEDGEEPLAWILLKKEEDRVLLLCRDCVACRPFHGSFEAVSWAESDLRAWLNGAFFDAAFDENEALRAAPVRLGGEEGDRVFLLSLEEAERYLGGRPELLSTLPTAAAQAALMPDQDLLSCCWWLRSPGFAGTYAAYVGGDGTLTPSGIYCDCRTLYVRPALWLYTADGAEESASAAESAEAPQAAPAEPPLELAETPDMGQEYVERIIFVGDSTTYGYTTIGMPYYRIWTADSHTMSIYEQSYVYVVTGKYPAKYMTLREAAAYYQPDMLVITLGMRWISMMNEELFKSEYTDLVTGLQAASPNTKIILNSIYPVAAHLDRTQLDITNEMIDETNSWVRDVAEATGVRYLDSNSCLRGENGFMVGSYAIKDGLHLNPTGLQLVLDYIRTHAYQ